MAVKRRGSGEDSVYFDQANGYWVGSVSLGFTPDGKRRRRKVRGRTKTKVRDKLRELLGLRFAILFVLGLWFGELGRDQDLDLPLVEFCDLDRDGVLTLVSDDLHVLERRCPAIAEAMLTQSL